MSTHAPRDTHKLPAIEILPLATSIDLTTIFFLLAVFRLAQNVLPRDYQRLENDKTGTSQSHSRGRTFNGVDTTTTNKN